MKPDDVSQRDWEAACDVTDGLMVDSVDALSTTITIARAITAAVAAEREACAQVALGRFTLDSVLRSRNGRPYAAGFGAIAASEQIAAAIRARSAS